MEWEQPGFPYLAFLSVAESFSGRLLRRLAIDKDHFPTRRVGPIITMDSKLVDAWVRLEANLLRMIDILKKSADYHAIRFPSPS